MSLSQNPVFSYQETQNIEISPLAKPKVLIVGLSNSKQGLDENVNRYGADGVGAVYGETQHITTMLRESLGIIENSFARPEISAFAFSDTGFVASVFEITFSAWTKNETMQLVAGEYTTYNKHLYELSLTNAQTGSQIATAFANLINADSKRQVEAVAGTNKITLTAKQAGKQSNDIQIFIKNLSNLTGGTVTITQPTPGTSEPDATALGNLVSAIEGKRYNLIVYPFQTNATLMNEIRSRSANGVVVDNKVLDGIVITGLNDIASNLITYATNNIQTTRNPLVCFGNKKISTGAFVGKYAISPSLLATKFATVLALAGTHKSTVLDYFIQKSYGYPALAVNTPLHNIIFADIYDTGYDGFTATDTTNLKAKNISLLSKENNYIVSGVIYTLTSSSKYATLQSELQSQFFKEAILNFCYLGDLTAEQQTRPMLSRMTVFNIEESKQIIKGLLESFYEYFAGITPYYEALGTIDYHILRSDKKAEFMELIERTLHIAKNSQNQGEVFFNLLLEGVFAINNVFITTNKR